MEKASLLTFNPELKHKWRRVLDQVLCLNKWDSEDEIAWLCEAASMSSNILELGSYQATSTKAMALANPDAVIHCIDAWDDAGTFDVFQDRMKDEIASGRVTFNRMVTEVGVPELAHRGEIFDMVFIDAGHTYECVMSDIITSGPLLSPNSILCGHDYRVKLPEDGVTKAVCELVPDHKVVADSIWAAIV